MHHEEQDNRSWKLHCAAIKLMKSDPAYIDQALAIIDRWESMGKSQSMPYWAEWRRILKEQDWDDALSLDQRATARRQASPCSCILPEQQRLDIIGVRLPDSLKNLLPD